MRQAVLLFTLVRKTLKRGDNCYSDMFKSDIVETQILKQFKIGLRQGKI